MLTVSLDGIAKVWDAATGECRVTLSGHAGSSVPTAVFSAGGSSVLTSSDDESAMVWDSATGQCTQTFSGHADQVFSAFFLQVKPQCSQLLLTRLARCGTPPLDRAG